MTISGKKFLEEQENNQVQELTTGTNTPDFVKNKIKAQQSTATIPPATPQQKKELEDAAAEEEKRVRLNTYKASPLETAWEGIKQIPSAILGTAEKNAGEAATEITFDVVYQRTKDIDEERAKNYKKVQETAQKIKEFAKPLLEKNKTTEGLIDTARTGNENPFEDLYKNNAEYGAGSVINTAFPEKWIDEEGNIAYYTNGKNTVSKPILKNLLTPMSSRIQNAYNSITYNFAHGGNVLSVDQVKEYYTEWENVPNDVIQQFINDACSDVQEGKRRPIEKYMEYYPALSNSDGYISQKDSMLQLMVNEQFLNWGLADFLYIQTEDGEEIKPGVSLESRVGADDLLQLAQASNIIKSKADELNEVGANVTQATDYAIVKSYAGQNPELKAAIDTFDRITNSFTNKDFKKLVGNYTKNILSLKTEYESYGGEGSMTKAQMEKKVNEILWNDMREANEEFLNSWNKERLQGNFWYAGAGKIDSYILGLQNAYRADDGKWYDKDGNEIEQTEVRRGITGRYLETLMNMGQTASDLGIEWDLMDEDPTKESVVNVLSDNINLYFDAWNMSKGGFTFNLKTQIPFVGPLYEQLIGGINEVAGESILGLANMTLFADGEWSEESQEKFKGAAGGLVSILAIKEIEKAKGYVKQLIKNDIYQSALKKSIGTYVDELAKGIRVIDVLEEKSKILQNEQPEPKPGENAKGEKQIEQTAKVQKIIFIRNTLDKALKAFNTTFEGELTKNAEKGQKPSILDILWNTATRLARGEKGKSIDEILEEGVKGTENKIVENEKEIADLENEKSELDKKETKTEEETKRIDEINERINNLKVENDSLNKRNENVKAQQTEGYHDKQVEIEDKKVEVENKQQQRDELNQRLKDIDNEIINAKGEGNTELVNELRQEKKDAKEQISKIEDEISKIERDLRSMEGKGTLKDALEDIKQGAREAYQETKEGLKGRKEDITTPESPEVKVEETKPGTPEVVEGVAKTEEKKVNETRTTVAKILDIIQKLQDNAKSLYDKLTAPREMSEDKKIRQREIERQERADELLNRMGDEGKLDRGTLDKLEDNRATDEIMRIVDRQTEVETDTKGRPKNVTPKKDEKFERDLSKDDVEREVLSSGLTRMQQYVDNIKSLLKKIGEVYEKLSEDDNIDSVDFIKGDILRNLLDKFNLRIDIEENEDGTQKAKVSKKKNVDTTGVEDGIIKYVEDFINKTLKFEMKSEADVQADRTKLTWNEDTYGKYDDGFENEFRKAFNDFLDTKADQTELLRKLDEQFSNLKENLEAFDDFMNKKGELKNSAKNKILKLGKEDLAQLEQILPGITKLVELTKISYDLVSKVKKAKMQYKDSNLLRGHWVRYMGVMAASNVAGYLSFGLLGIPLASLAFVALERLGTAGKRKVSPKELDRSTYSKYVDLLKVDGNEKAEYKQGELERIKKESEILKGKKEAEVQQTLNDAMEILIKRKANELIQQKAREEERERRVREREDRERKEAWDKSLQPIDNALPGVKPDVVTPEGEVTLGRGNPISPASTKTNRAKPITEVKETYKDKEKTQKGYSEAENKIIETALGLEEKEYSKDSEELANVIEESVDSTSRIMKKNAVNKLEEKGEDVTPENIAKEIQKEPSSIEEFIMEAEKGAPEERTNYDGADIKDLEEVVANPKKYPNVDIEAAKAALEKARRQNIEAEIMQSPDQQQAQKEIAGIYKGSQMEREGNKEREKQREDMVREINRDFDTLETTEEYDRIENQITPEKGEQAKKYAKGYKGFYRSDKAKTDTLRADMGKKASQNITYTSSADKIATLENPTSRARVAQERLNKRKRLSEEEKTQLNQIIEQANVEIQAKEELKAQKTELANEYKRLDKKRSETPYRETKKEITKQMDKISDEFDKLTYEEAGELFSKPKEVEEMEAKEQGEIQEFDKAMDENETPQKAEPEIKEQETKNESEGERSFGDEEYTNRDNKIEEMSKDESITIKDTINEVEEIVGGGIKDYQEKIYGEKRDKEESYTNNGAESFRNKVNDKIRERDKKFWEDQRSKTKDMESTKLTKEQEKQLEEAKTKEEKDALMNKWRKEYIERNPIAEEYLKEAEEHNEQFQKAMDALGKIDAIVRRIRRKRREDIDKRWEETKRKLREEKKKEIDLLDQNETPQIDEIPQEVSSEKVVEGKKETKSDKLSREERKQLNQINKEIEDSIFYKGGTDARGSMTDREKIEFTNTLSPHEEFYHASDTNIKEGTFDLSKTKDDPNGLGLAVSTSKDNPYGGKKHQYTINGKNMLIAKEGTTTSESNIRDISEILQIEPNAAWQYVPLAELTSIIRGEVEAKFGEANNADILKAFRDVTKYDGIDTSHGYTLLWNVDKINANAKKNKGGDKPEEPTTPKKPEPTKPQSPKGNMMANVKLSEEYGERKNGEAARPGDGPLLFVENDGTIRSVDEPGLGDIPTYKIQTRIDFLKQKRADNGKKLYAKELSELKFLQDLYKRQVEWEGREKQGDITDEDYVKAYETGGGGVDKAPF